LGADGKGAVLTNLLAFWTRDRSIFERETFPTMIDEFEIPFDLKSKKIGSASDESVLLDFKDTNPRADQLRRISYPGTDCFLLVISVVRLPMSRSLVEDIKNWLLELKENGPSGVPVVVIGVMGHKRQVPEVIDQLQEKKQSPLSKEEGEKVATEGGAFYMEVDLRSTEGRDWNQCLALCAKQGGAYHLKKTASQPRKQQECIVQ